MRSRNPWLGGAGMVALWMLMSSVSPQLQAQQAGGPASSTASPTQPASTQTPPATPQTPTSSPSKPGHTDPPLQESTKPENDRIFWTLPNYLTVERKSALPPLTAREKFILVAKGTFDPVEFGYLGLVAGINQATNANPSYGQGFKGYAKRYGTAFADNAVENFMVGGVFPSLLHQDPRYYQLGKGSFLHRAGYAGLRVFITRSDSGKSEFNWSELLGAGVAAGISNAYHPPPRTFGSNMSVWWTQIGWDAVSDEVKEFWPDIHRYFINRKH